MSEIKERSGAQPQGSKAGWARKTNVFLAILTAIIASSYVGYLLWLASPFFNQISDLPEYVVAARLYADGHGSSVYVTPDWASKRAELFPLLRPRGLSIFSPPPSLFLLAPLALVPLKYVAGVWLALQVLAAAASVLLFKRLFTLNAEQTALLWTALFFSGPLFESLLIGQLAPFLLLALSIAIVSLEKNRPLPAAMALAVFILKPQEIATFALFLLGARKFKVVLYGVIVMAVVVVATLLSAGPEAFIRYFELLKNLDALATLMTPQITPTIRGQMLRLGMNIGLIGLVSKVAMLAALAFSFWLGERLRNSPDWVKLGIQGTLPLGFLTALYAQSYDLIILAPSAVALFSYPPKDRLDRLLLFSAGLCLCVFVQPVFRFIHYDMKALPVNLHFVGLAIFACACVILAVRRARWSTTRAVND
jgi:hypothetical protein